MACKGKMQEDSEFCCICFETKSMMRLQCGHEVCQQCVARIKASLVEVDPCAFGCPSCRHCMRSISRPCCEKDIKVLREWERESPECYRSWVWAECDRAMESQAACPLCRGPLRAAGVARDDRERKGLTPPPSPGG